MKNELDIIIPVYNEGASIKKLIKHLEKTVKTNYKIFIIYDSNKDTTLDHLKKIKSKKIILIKNNKIGPHSAVLTGFKKTKSKFILTYMADDFFNGPIIDTMINKMKKGSDIVVASRFIKGGIMKGAPFPKNYLVLISSYLLNKFTNISVHDSTNGFRLFSRKILNKIEIKSKVGFTYSIELLVKATYLNYKISEIPCKWFERKKGKSSFKVFKWFFPYLKYFIISFYLKFKSFFL